MAVVVSVSQMVQSFTRTRPSVMLGELPVGLVVEILRDVLSGRVEHREGLEVIEHLMVDAVDDRAQHLLQQLEVEQQAGLRRARRRPA